VTDVGEAEGTEERGEESVPGCDMAAVLVGVVVELLVRFRGVGAFWFVEES
jgi:hypothetical protein